MSIDFNKTGRGGDRVKDWFADASEFEALLDDAEQAAETSREHDFLEGLRERYEEWGMKMYLSDAQHSWLIRIAEGD